MIYNASFARYYPDRYSKQVIAMQAALAVFAFAACAGEAGPAGPKGDRGGSRAHQGLPEKPVQLVQQEKLKLPAYLNW